MTLVVAHAGHWLLAIGYAGPPLMVIGAISGIAIRERRRGGNAG